MELNPNNPVVRQVHDHWHKIAALLMVKFDKQEVEITMRDLEKLLKGNINIVLDARGESERGSFFIRLVDDKTAAELARQEGGRPQDC